MFLLDCIMGVPSSWSCAEIPVQIQSKSLRLWWQELQNKYDRSTQGMKQRGRAKFRIRWMIWSAKTFSGQMVTTFSLQIFMSHLVVSSNVLTGGLVSEIYLFCLFMFYAVHINIFICKTWYRNHYIWRKVGRMRIWYYHITWYQHIYETIN